MPWVPRVRTSALLDTRRSLRSLNATVMLAEPLETPTCPPIPRPHPVTLLDAISTKTGRSTGTDTPLEPPTAPPLSSAANPQVQEEDLEKAQEHPNPALEISSRWAPKEKTSAPLVTPGSQILSSAKTMPLNSLGVRVSLPTGTRSSLTTITPLVATTTP